MEATRQRFSKRFDQCILLSRNRTSLREVTLYNSIPCLSGLKTDVFYFFRLYSHYNYPAIIVSNPQPSGWCN